MMKKSYAWFGWSCCAALGVCVAGCNAALDSEEPDEPLSEAIEQSLTQAKPQLVALGTYLGEGEFASGACEIVAFEPALSRMWVTNANRQRLDVISIRDPSQPTLVQTIPLTPYGNHANSVAVSRYGIVAAAVEAVDPQAPGSLVLFDLLGRYLAQVEVGAMPDMVTFTPNGRWVLTANEGEPNSDYTVDPEGSVSIVDLWRGPRNVRQSDVKTAGFHTFDDAELDPTIRIFGPGASVSQDMEPEFIAVSHDSRTAWVTLQENNAIATIDIGRANVTRLVGLGYKDHSLPGNGLDPSDKDEGIHIATYPVRGWYMPDGIAAFKSWGRTYLLMANEGDSRDYDGFTEEARCGTLLLDPTAFPNAEELQKKPELGRLTCSLMDGDIDGDGDFDALYSYGARSFSIRDTRGRLVYDSGDQIEQLTAQLYPDGFNSTNDENDSFDTRSDNKGPEPEGVAVGTLRGHTYGFLGLERIGGILVYDLTSPRNPAFVQYINTRDFSGDPEAGTAGDLGPEGLTFVPAHLSPIHQALLLVANEISGTTTIFKFD